MSTGVETRKKNKALENTLKKDVLKFLESSGVFCFRNNTGAIISQYKGKTRFFKFGAVGSGDIFALHRGVFVSIELKSPGKHPTFDQESWMERVRHHGGAASWFCGKDEFIQWWDLTFPPGGGTNVLR